MKIGSGVPSPSVKPQQAQITPQDNQASKGASALTKQSQGPVAQQQLRDAAAGVTTLAKV